MLSVDMMSQAILAEPPAESNISIISGSSGSSRCRIIHSSEKVVVVGGGGGDDDDSGDPSSSNGKANKANGFDTATTATTDDVAVGNNNMISGKSSSSLLEHHRPADENNDDDDDAHEQSTQIIHNASASSSSPSSSSSSPSPDITTSVVAASSSAQEQRRPSNTTSNNTIPHQPILVIAPPDTPLGIDINMITPTISYIQPNSPLVNQLQIGDVLVYIDGRSTADLSHRIVTKLLNGGGVRSRRGSNISSCGGGGDRSGGESSDGANNNHCGEKKECINNEQQQQQHHTTQHHHQRKFVFLSRGGGGGGGSLAHSQQNQMTTTTTTPLPSSPSPPLNTMELAASANSEVITAPLSCRVEEEEEVVVAVEDNNQQGENNGLGNKRNDNTTTDGGCDGGVVGQEGRSPRSVIVKLLSEEDDTNNCTSIPAAAGTTTIAAASASPTVRKHLRFDSDDKAVLSSSSLLSHPLSNDDVPTSTTTPVLPMDSPIHLNNLAYYYPNYQHINNNNSGMLDSTLVTTPLPLLTPVTPLPNTGSSSSSSVMSGASSNSHGCSDDSESNQQGRGDAVEVLDDDEIMTYFSGKCSMMDDSHTFLSCRTNSGHHLDRLAVDMKCDATIPTTTPLERQRSNERIKLARVVSIQEEEEDEEDEESSCSSSLVSSHRRCVSCPGAIGGTSSTDGRRVIHDEEQVSNKFHEQEDSSDTTNKAIEILRTDQQVVVREDNILNEEVNNLGKVGQSGDEEVGDASSLPSSPMDADIGMNDNDENDDDNSNNNVNTNNIKKRTSPRLERRRNKHPAPPPPPPPPPPPGIDYITVPYGSTEHDNHQHPSIIIDEDISTIYGGVWNSGALLTGGRRLEDMMGCLEEGYAIHSSGICGIGGLKYDPNTHSQLRMKQPTKHRCQQPNCVSVSPKPKSQFCVEEDVEETRKTVALWNVWRQQRLCVDGSLVALLLVVVLSFIAIIVLVLRK